MRAAELNRQLQALRTLFTRVHDASGDEIELQAHWAKYLCVLTAGFIENAIKYVYIRFARGSASEAVANYAVRALEQVQNPKCARILDLAGAFRVEWRDQLNDYLGEEGRREAIDSIMQHRHLIAHGQSSAITLVRVREYLSLAVQVVEFIEAQTGT